MDREEDVAPETLPLPPKTLLLPPTTLPLPPTREEPCGLIRPTRRTCTAGGTIERACRFLSSTRGSNGVARIPRKPSGLGRQGPICWPDAIARQRGRRGELESYANWHGVLIEGLAKRLACCFGNQTKNWKRSPRANFAHKFRAVFGRFGGKEEGDPGEIKSTNAWRNSRHRLAQDFLSLRACKTKPRTFRMT
jgi:hypothetical protein